jgi:hypothetical protein
VPLRLVDEVVEDVVDLLSEKRGKFLSKNGSWIQIWILLSSSKNSKKKT